MHHLFGAAVGWTYHTAPGFDPTLGRGSASVAFGPHQIVLQRTRAQPFSIRCTLVNGSAEPGAAVPVADRLRLLIDRVLQRFPTLRYRALLPLPSAPDVLMDRGALMSAAADYRSKRCQTGAWKIERR